MSSHYQKQTRNVPIDVTVTVDGQTKEQWLTRFKISLKRFDSFAHMVNQLAEQDDHYKQAEGVLLLQRIQLGRGRLSDTAKATLLMEQLRPELTPDMSLLSRQKINLD